MIDIKIIRENPELIKKAVVDKGIDVDVDRFLELNKIIVAFIQEIDDLRHKQKSFTKDDLDVARLNKEALKKLEVDLKQPNEEYLALYAKLPNLPSQDTPVGKDESENKVLRQVGDKPNFNFAPLTHWELGEKLGVIDNEKAAEISGARFTYLKGDLALLQFALIQYTFTILTDSEKLKEIAGVNSLTISDKPFLPVIPPVFVKTDVMRKMARLEPIDDRYVFPEDNLCLIGSAEHTLGPLHMNETIPANNLPIRYVGYSTAFRREAGTYGKDTKGILRLHQFDKLEMESFTTPSQGLKEQDLFVAIQEYLVGSLALPYQVVLKCTGDMGAPDARAIDIETWMPGQNTYRETHTADYMTDYQARRLGTKYQAKDGEKDFVHMNDGTAFAIGRTLIAIMENYQQQDGTIMVPKVLVPFMGKETISHADNR